MSSLDKQTPTRLENGLNRDFNFQKPGDATFVLNGIRDADDGGFAEYQSEPGNSSYYQLPNGYRVIGSIYGTDNRVYLFSTNGPRSEIGVQRANHYDTLVNADFDFDSLYPITGEFRIRNHCNRTIYWSDGVNPDRWFDEDNQEQFQDGSGNWVVDKFNFTPIVIPPDIDLVSVNDSGGRLLSGTYQFQMQILDKNENIIYTSDISPQVPIFRDSLGSGYEATNGSLNIATTPEESGGEPITTKSITLQVSQLDTNFEYIRFVVIYKTTNNEIQQAHLVANLIPITSDTINWTYVGFNPSAGDFELDVTESLINNQRYDSAYVMEQVDGRLLRANLKQDVNDYTMYQQAASQITAKWVAKEHEAKNQESIGNAKNPKTYWYNTGFQADEVYLFGIRYMHSNGTWSPVFPLIGRDYTIDDVVMLTVIDNADTPGIDEVWLSEVEHLGFETITDDIGHGAGLVPTWKVYNTAVITDSDLTAHPYTFEGEFGYYESTEEYPEIYDCNNQLVWGENVPEGSKVRLFKFPDRRLISHQDSDSEYLRNYGIKFENITYPVGGIVGHQFVHANRDAFNKTVVDTGWSYQLFASLVDVDESIYEGVITPFMIDHSDSQTKNLYSFDSVKTIYDSSLEPFTYLKSNNYHKFESPTIEPPFTTFTLDNGSDLESVVMNATGGSFLPSERQNFKQTNQYLVLPLSRLEDSSLPLNIRNDDCFTNGTMIQLSYSEGMDETEVNFPGQDIIGDGGLGTYKVQKNNFYVYKKTLNIPYLNLLAQTYRYLNYNVVKSTTPELNTFYNGDIIIAENRLVRGDPNSVLLDPENAATSQLLTYVHRDMYVETEINCELRIEGTNEAYKYFGYGDDDEYLISKVTIPSSINPNEYTKILPSQFVPESYQYSSDYTLSQFEQTKLSLPLTYDYCSECLGLYPNRIIFSPKSFDEESFDLFRINKTNDYIDLPAHRGEITGLQYKNNYLIVRTTETTFILRPQPQTISTDQSSVYLTSGDFLSIIPQEIAQSDVGYAGMQSKISEVNTPYGLYWVDQKRGQVFRFTNTLEELSSPEFGLSQWLKENLPSALDNAFLLNFNEHYPHNKTTTATKGVGCMLFYDPRFKRVLIHKKDYHPTLLGDEYTYSFLHDVFYVSSVSTPLRLWDPVYFENRSFTLSFSVDYNKWTSWHSYLPFYAFNDETHFYTLQESQVNRPYKHLHRQFYQRFYNSKKPFIVEFMIADMNTDQLNAVHYVGYSQRYDPLLKQYYPDDNYTFDRVMCYNSHQNTGLQTLVLQNQQTNPYQNTTLPSASKYVIKTDNNYKVSGLYDMSTAVPVTSASWTDIQSSYPIDIVAKNIDPLKSQYQWSKLKDKYVFVRLYLTTTQDIKKVINLIQTHESYSIR